MKSILFVCMGNICRSPAAETIFKDLLLKHNIKMDVDSAGMVAHYCGEKADARMREHGQRRGYTLTSISRKFDADSDFDHFDMIIAMDQHNINDLKNAARTNKDFKKVHLMTDFLKHTKSTHVPDPYLGGSAGFESVYELLEEACKGLLDHLSH